jgi:hypothetical protein
MISANRDAAGWGTYEGSPAAFLGMDVTVKVTEADG